MLDKGLSRRPPGRIVPDIPLPPAPVSPLSSTSISSPVRGRRYSKRNSRSSSQSSTSSSTPRSVIKTPSPLPTKQAIFLDTNSSEDERKEKKKNMTPKKYSKSKKRNQGVRNDLGKKEWLLTPGTNSDLEGEHQEQKSKPKGSNEIIETTSNMSKYLNEKYSTNSEHKGRKGNLIGPYSSPEKKRNRSIPPSKTSTNVPASMAMADENSVMQLPTLVNPLGDQTDSLDENSSFAQENHKISNDCSSKDSEVQNASDFVQPVQPSRVLKRPRQLDIEDRNITEAGNDLERLLEDVNYYPVQPNHKDFIPISKFEEPEYVEFLLLIQVRKSFLTKVGLPPWDVILLNYCKCIQRIYTYIYIYRSA